jgi:chromosome segregation ATPase
MPTPAELRAALAPMLGAYRALASLDDVLNEVIQHQSSLKSLAKRRDDLTTANTALRTEQDRLNSAVSKLKEQAQAAQKALASANSEIADGRLALRAEQEAQAATLKGQRDALQFDLQKITERHQRAAQEARDDLARVQAELQKAKDRLAQFHSGVTSLAR